MRVFITHRELRNGKIYDTLSINRIIDTDCSKTNVALNALFANTYCESEERILTQRKVDEQIETYIARLTKQLEDLTRLIHGMPNLYRHNLSARSNTSASSSPAGASPDLVTGIRGISPDGYYFELIPLQI